MTQTDDVPTASSDGRDGSDAPALPIEAAAEEDPYARPDWQARQETIDCPLCGYNLYGLSEPLCPECGFRFEWRDLLDPTRRRHPYLFEHHPNRNLRSFWKTAVGGLRPRRFWTSLIPSQPSNPRRLFRYWVTAVIAGGIGLAGPWTVEPVLHIASSLLTGHSMPRQFFGNQSSIPVHLGGKYLRFDNPLELVVFPAAALVLWPWLSFAALMVFQISMRRARVLPVHVLRCLLYSADLIFWLGLGTLVATVVATLWTGMFGAAGPSTNDDASATIAFGASLFAGVTLIYRLGTAYKLYLRFSQPFGTVLLSQVIVLLTYVTLFLYLTVW